MPSLSKAQAYTVFAGVLVAYTVQCELASFLNRVGYDKSFFLLYLTHSSYTIIGILHYAALRILGVPVAPLLDELRTTLHKQLDASSRSSNAFPLRQAIQRLLAITVLIALPAGIWYAAIPITSMTSLTALYNLNAFWAYILSIYYSRSERWELRSALAVGIACCGVLVMTYGDSREDSPQSSEESLRGNYPLLGDLLGLISSFACGFYEVWYKKYIALPSASDDVAMSPTKSAYAPLARRDRHSRNDGNANSPPSREVNGVANDDDDDDDGHGEEDELDQLEAELYAAKILSPGMDSWESPSRSDSQNVAPSLFLMHANSITCLIGISTMLLLWIPIPILHWTGMEPFELPRSLGMYAAVAGVCFCGVMFNAGFMILLAQWGPVVTSVGNLFTLILVAASDEVIALTNGFSALSVSTLIGSGFILASFGMLMTGGPAHSTEQQQALSPGRAREIGIDGLGNAYGDSALPFARTRPGFERDHTPSAVTSVPMRHRRSESEPDTP